jgi:hypothetical protein
MIEENVKNPQPNRKKGRELEIFQDAIRAICMHLKQCQIRLKTNRKFERFLGLSIRIHVC